MRKYLLFVCLSLCLVGCKKENLLEFSTKTFELKSNVDCEIDNCTYIHLEIPIATGNEMVTKQINDSIFSFVEKTTQFNSDKKTTSYDTLALNFIVNYNEVNRTYPGNTLAWEANFKLNHKALSPNVYQVCFNYYIFTGGAHGLQAVKVFLFDTATGNTIPKKDLFVNFEGFKKYAETQFKAQMNVSGNFNDAGFTFENNKFKLPKNFYETANEWVLHYNPYEIAPYVQGSTIIKLPKQQVDRFLNPIYFKN